MKVWLINHILGDINFEYKEKRCDNFSLKYFIAEYWTSKQKQANSIHEISYRACFKPQLPSFFIKKLSKDNDWIYDPFMGRGTTLVEGTLLNRNVIGNDINPLCELLSNK